MDIELTEPVALTFSLKYLVNFCKAQPLSDRVKICLSNEVPLLVEYLVTGTSYLRFYLAPKVCSITSLPVRRSILTVDDRLVMRTKGFMCQYASNHDFDERHYTNERRKQKETALHKDGILRHSYRPGTLLVSPCDVDTSRVKFPVMRRTHPGRTAGCVLSRLVCLNLIEQNKAALLPRRNFGIFRVTYCTLGIVKRTNTLNA